jgi:hypothetical protein
MRTKIIQALHWIGRGNTRLLKNCHQGRVLHVIVYRAVDKSGDWVECEGWGLEYKRRFAGALLLHHIPIWPAVENKFDIQNKNQSFIQCACCSNWLGCASAMRPGEPFDMGSQVN